MLTYGLTTPSGDNLAIREASHRIKNDLQLLSSWIAMSAREGSSPERIIPETMARIQMIARLHDALASSPMGSVSMRSQLSELVADLSSLGGCADRHIDIQAAGEIDLSVAQARLALVLAHELMANALRHAFGPAGGRLGVDLSRRQAMNTLTVCDDGVARAAPSRTGEGSRIVDGIVRALGGALVVRPLEPSGLKVEIAWPAETRLQRDLTPVGDDGASVAPLQALAERRLAA